MCAIVAVKGLLSNLNINENREFWQNNYVDQIVIKWVIHIRITCLRARGVAKSENLVGRSSNAARRAAAARRRLLFCQNMGGRAPTLPTRFLHPGRQLTFSNSCHWPPTLLKLKICKILMLLIILFIRLNTKTKMKRLLKVIEYTSMFFIVVYDKVLRCNNVMWW